MEAQMVRVENECTRNALKWQFVVSNIATVFSTRSKNVDSMLVVSSLNWKAPREYRSIASTITSLALTWILTRVSLVTLLDTSHRLVISTWTTIDSSQITLTSPKLSSQSRQQTTDNRQQTTDNRQQTTDNRQQTTDNRQQTTDNRQQTTDNRQQTTGDWRLATGDWRLATGDWRLDGKYCCRIQR
jgi:hypothetical protein